MGLANWRALERANGGWIGETGQIPERLIKEFSQFLEQGALWRTYSQESGRILFESRLKVTGTSGGAAVDISGEGPGQRAFREGDRMLFQSRSYRDWVQQSGDPHKCGGSKRIQIDLGRSRISWKPADATYTGDESNGAIFWAPGQDLSRVAFTLRKTGDDAGFDMLVEYRDSDEGESVGCGFTTAQTIGLGAGNPDGTEFEVNIPSTGSGSDTVRISVAKDGAGAVADAERFWITDLRVNAIAEDDEFTAGDVVKEVAHQLGISDRLVKDPGIDVLPLDYQGATYAEILDDMALLSGWRWLIWRDEAGIVMDFRPYSTNRWQLLDPEAPRDLIPQPRFNIVRVPFKHEDGEVLGYAKAKASPNPLKGKYVTTIELERPGSEGFAKNLAQHLADFLVTERWAGSLTCSRLQDEQGRRVSVHQARAGDQVFVPGLGSDGKGRYLSIDEMERGVRTATLSIASGIPLLDRINTRRGLRGKAG